MKNRYFIVVLKHLALCAVCGFPFVIAPPVGLGLMVIIAWLVGRKERLEFLCLLPLTVFFPTLGLLPLLTMTVRGGTVFFLSLAVLRGFFEWFRPDPMPGASDIGPDVSATEMYTIMAVASVAGIVSAIVYPWLLTKRLQREQRNSL